MSKTLIHSLIEAKKRGSTVATFFKKDGQWNEITWQEYCSRAEKVAAGFSALGLQKGDTVALVSETRHEWSSYDLGVLSCGGITVPIYPSNTEEDFTYILNNSEAKFFILENEIQYKKWKSISGDCPTVKTLLSMEEIDDPNVISFQQIMEKGEELLKENPDFLEKAADKSQLEDTATILYTSGTTGLPKGVVLTYTQIMSELEEVMPLIDLSGKDKNLAFLPISHIFGRIEMWGQLFVGYQTAYAESIEKIKDNLGEMSPTFLLAVPRIFEKIYNGVLSKAETSPVKKKLFDWALAVGSQVSEATLAKKPVPLVVGLQYKIATKLVFSKLHQGLGGRLRWAISGSAPLSKQISQFFHSAGILVLEAYGLTETTAGITANLPHDYSFGNVGKAIGEAQLKIADDGEILIKSKKVMKEYYKNPEATAEAIKDGWFYTGDIGELDSEGRLKITDRKKDLIKTAGGKYVAPQKLEGLLKLNKYVSNVLIHGDQKKYVVALITLDPDETAKFAASKGIDSSDIAALSKKEELKSLIKDAIAETNNQLASFETIKNFAILPKDFTIEDGELTPSMKVKRKVCDKKYKDIIEGLYGADRSSL